jgi:thiamine kinase-like enzyme
MSFAVTGQSTEKLIDRQGEKHAYELIEPLGLADEIVFFDGRSGVKVSRYYEGARVSDPQDDARVAEASYIA